MSLWSGGLWASQRKRRDVFGELEQRDGATLSLDFAKGQYYLAGEERTATTDPSKILTVERASPKWVMGPEGKLVEVPPDTLAREWKDGKCQGALIEESRTNLLQWSEDFTQSPWSTFSTAFEEGKISPDGESLALKATVSDGGSPTNAITQDIQVEEGDYVASFYAAPGGLDWVRFVVSTPDYVVSSYVNLRTGALSDGDDNFYTELFGEWVRIFCSFSTGSHGDARFRIRPTSDSGVSPYVGDGESGIYIWGAQLEKGSTPSSYIPTEDAPVTRAADQVSRALGGEFDHSAGRFVVEAAVPEGDAVLTFGTESIVSTSDEMTEYELNYDSDPDATDLVLGEGVIKSVIYLPGGQHD